ncbi:unnamed protein product [Aphanomyces euteiches]
MSEIIAPASLPMQYIEYSSRLEGGACPTNFSKCVASTAYVPMLSRLPNDSVNLTFYYLKSDIPRDQVDRHLVFNLSSSVFLSGPTCSGTCNDTTWTTIPKDDGPISFLLTNASGLMDVLVASRYSSLIRLSSMDLKGADVVAPSNQGFAPTVSFESDPVRMRLSMFLPPVLSNLTVCLALNEPTCSDQTPHWSFDSLYSNASFDQIQGTISVGINMTNMSTSSFCMILSWDARLAAQSQQIGLAISGVSISSNSSTPVVLPEFMQWTASGTDAQCVPVTSLASPRSKNSNMVPKTLWTVISLVLYIFAFVIACLLVRLHGLTFVRETMYTDLALLSIICLLLCSVLLHILWLTILNRLPGTAIETGFLVAILDGLRQSIMWTLLASICIQWFAVVHPQWRTCHHGKLLLIWVMGVLVYLVLLLLYVVQNYGLLKCTYVDYVRNYRGGDRDLWLPVIQPGDWKFAVDKVCFDYGSRAGFVYTFGCLHCLPLGLLVLLLIFGTRLVSRGLRGLDSHHSVVQWAMCSLGFVVVTTVVVLVTQQGMTMYLYAKEKRVAPLVWLVVGEYLPTLVPSLGFLLLQWNSKLFALPARHLRATSSLAPPPPLLSTWNKPFVPDTALMSQRSLMSQRTAELTVAIRQGSTLANMVVEIHQAGNSEGTDTWKPVATISSEDKMATIKIYWQPLVQLRCTISVQPHRASLSATDYFTSMEELLQGPQEYLTSSGAVVVLSVALSSSISKTLSVASDVEITEHLRESQWPTDVALAYLKHLSLVRKSMYNAAVADIDAFEAAQQNKMNYANIIDQIQGESDVDLVRRWLHQRSTKRLEYHNILQKCLELYKDRRRQGVFLKKSTEKVDSLLRFLPVNFHFHDMQVNAAEYSTMTLGTFACHNLSKSHAPLLDDDEVDSGDRQALKPSSFADERVRYRDEVEWSTIIRQDECNGQALSTLAASVVDRVEAAIRSSALDQVWSGWAETTYLFQVESLLSDHGKESRMLEECAGATYWLASSTLGLAFQDPSSCRHPLSGVVRVELTANDSKNDSTPCGFHIVLYLCCAHAFDAASCVKVTPLLFSQGINEMQTLANKATMYKETLPDAINDVNGRRLEKYIGRRQDWPHMEDIQGKLGQLQDSILTSRRERVKKKHPEILQYAGQITRLLGGARVTCCKSGKDRTAMSVTLEHGWILSHFHHMNAPAVRRAVSIMRSEGVRLDCVEKNIGKRQYAFNALQRSMLPEAYRCPEGTYGNGNAS